MNEAKYAKIGKLVCELVALLKQEDGTLPLPKTIEIPKDAFKQSAEDVAVDSVEVGNPTPVVEEPKKRGRPAKAKEEYPVITATGPVDVVELPPVKEESIDDMFAEAPVVKEPKTAADVKQQMINWLTANPTRKTEGPVIFKNLTGFPTFIGLSDEQATEAYYKLDAGLKNA